MVQPRGDSLWNHPFTAPAALCVLYTVAATLLFSRMGLLAHLEDIAFCTPDSQGYKAIADFLVGRAPRPALLLFELRPLFYPLLLSSYHLVGVAGLFVLQWLLAVATLGVVFLTLRRHTGSGWLGLVGASLLALHPTFAFLPLHALAEPLSFVLVALAISQLLRFWSDRHGGSLALACFLLGASTCAKPVYLPFCLSVGAYGFSWLLRERLFSIRGIAATGLSVSPLVVQLVLSCLLTGQATISTAGRYNFDERFLPVASGFERGLGFVPYDSAEARAARARYPSHADKLRFVATHPVATLQAAAHLLKANLLSASAFVRGASDVPAETRSMHALQVWSGWLNAAMAGVHALCLVVLIGAQFLANRPVPGGLVFLAAMSFLVLLSSVLTYWQGDRLLLSAVPIWAVAYPAIGHALAAHWRKANRASPVPTGA